MIYDNGRPERIVMGLARSRMAPSSSLFVSVSVFVFTVLTLDLDRIVNGSGVSSYR